MPGSSETTPSTSTWCPSHGGFTGALTSVCSVRKYISPSYSASQHGTVLVSRTMGSHETQACAWARPLAARAQSADKPIAQTARAPPHNALRKLSEVFPLLVGEADVEAAIVEIDHLAQACRPSRSRSTARAPTSPRSCCMTIVPTSLHLPEISARPGSCV